MSEVEELHRNMVLGNGFLLRCHGWVGRSAGPAVDIALQMTDVLASSPFRGLPVTNQKRRGRYGSGYHGCSAKSMWLAVGVRLLANRHSSMVPWQPPCWGPKKKSDLENMVSPTSIPAHGLTPCPCFMCAGAYPSKQRRVSVFVQQQFLKLLLF